MFLPTFSETKERARPSYDISYTYDSVGNRLTKTDNASGETTSYTYDAANQLETAVDSSATTSYTYDAAGNLTKVEDPSSNVTSYTWDEENRRIKVELPSSEVITSTYNGDGQRVKREDSSETKKFIWDDENYLAETDENDVTQVVYTQKPDEFGSLIQQRRKDGASWSDEYYHFDALGSTVDVTDSSEATKNASPFVYDAWGNLQASYTFMPPFLFVGELGYYADDWTASDSVLDYYVRARTYDPVIARWLSADPIGFVDGGNLYRYARNSPITGIDPSGNKFTVKDRSDMHRFYLTKTHKAFGGVVLICYRALGDCKCCLDERRPLLELIERPNPDFDPQVGWPPTIFGWVNGTNVPDIDFEIAGNIFLNVAVTHKGGPVWTFGHEQHHVYNLIEELKKETTKQALEKCYPSPCDYKRTLKECEVEKIKFMNETSTKECILKAIGGAFDHRKRHEGRATWGGNLRHPRAGTGESYKMPTTRGDPTTEFNAKDGWLCLHEYA